MQVYLLRHGKTQGNLEGRYVGRTDEPLSPQGEQELLRRDYPPVERLYASPMRRCLQSAQLAYPQMHPILLEGLRETDFGRFEYQTYDQLRDCPAYRAWIDSCGKQAPLGGEPPELFRRRCLGAFLAALECCKAERIARVAFLTHGGVLMTLLEALSDPSQPFYHWQVENGGGWSAQVDWRLEDPLPVRLIDYRKLE